MGGHEDLNEFNLMVEDHDENGDPCDPKIVMIDFPQMIPIDHPDAKEQFYRDVKGICEYFRLKFDLELGEMPDFDEIIKEQEKLENLVMNENEDDIVGSDVLSWKMNLMDDARKIGNDTQGGWAPMPKLRREDDDNSSENEEELNQEEIEELEAEIDDLQPEEITNPNKPELIKEEEEEDQVSEISTEFAKRMAAIRTGMTEITGTTSVAPEQIKLRVKKAMELQKYRTKSGKLAKADKVNVKNRRRVANDIRTTMAGGSRFDD